MRKENIVKCTKKTSRSKFVEPATRPVIQALIESFQTELSTLMNSARAAYEEATHEESQSEDKHDTRAIEASYLAAGQVARAMELERIISEYKGYLETSHKSKNKVGPGALAELETNGKTICTFFARQGGGTKVTVNGKTIIVTTPMSPLGEALIDSEEDDEVFVDTHNGPRSYTVQSLQ